MSFEQRVAQLQQTNASLTEELIRVRNGALSLGRMYGSVSNGVDSVGDDEYFVVAGDGTYQRLYRRSGSSANLIAEYPSTDATEQIIEDAKDSAEARIADTLDLPEAYGPNLGFVVRERLRQEATLDLDFVAGEYRLQDSDTLETTDASEILTVERASPKWVMGPNGRLREVPPDTLAREWKDGKCQGVLVGESRTNLLLWSEGGIEAGSDGVNGWVYNNDLEVLDVYSADGVSEYTVSLPEGTNNTRLERVDVPREAGKVYTLSFDVMLLEGDAHALRSTIPGSEEATSRNWPPLIKGEWLRVSRTVTASSDTGGGEVSILRRRSNDGGDVTVKVRGIQFENGPTPSSYIPTEDAPVTRPADRVFRSMDGEFNSAQGTVVFSGTYIGVSSGGLMLFGQGHERIGIYPVANGYFFGSRDAAGDAPRSGIELDKGDPIKAAFTYSANHGVDVVFVANGEVVRSDSDLDISLTGLLDFRGRLAGSGFDNSPAHLQSFFVEYIPYALTEDEMIELTALRED